METEQFATEHLGKPFMDYMEMIIYSPWKTHNILYTNKCSSTLNYIILRTSCYSYTQQTSTLHEKMYKKATIQLFI